uniref:C-type lectin domain-containing protein n=1 Tax=Echeneis naucrates TaxID=173247 RepID=A0A665WWE2_ECHNA
DSNESKTESSLTVALLVVAVLLAAATIALGVTCDLCCNLFKDETYPRCEEGWEHNGGKCYLFSTNGSSWEKSRDECKQLGGDLVKIDSREEQVENTAAGPSSHFWIGLTDSKNEGDWLWVDGSPLDRNWTFWRSGEPDNWKEKDPDGEDCVAMGETGKIIESWTDGSCKTEYKSISPVLS